MSEKNELWPKKNQNFSSGTLACYFWVSCKKRKYHSLGSDQEFSLHRENVSTKQTLQVLYKRRQTVNIHPPCILTDSPNKVKNYTQWFTVFRFYCSLLPLIQTNNSTLNLTQRTRNQTGILYKPLSFYFKRPLKNVRTNVFMALYSYLKFMFEEIIPWHGMNQCTFLTLWIQRNCINFCILLLLVFAQLMSTS